MPIPDLVCSWEAISDTVFEFTLREGVLFHNGDVLRSHDIVASWIYARNYPYAAAVHERIVHFEAISDATIRIDTVEPHALLFHDLTHTGNMIMPKSLIESGHNFGALAVGTGPFVFQEKRLGNFMHHTVFENYFDTERAARLEYVTWQVLPDALHRGIALEIGEIDFDIYVQRRNVDNYLAHPDIMVSITPGTAHHKLILNHNVPQFQNLYVRRALGMAIDKEAVLLAAGLAELATPTWSQVPTIFEGGTDEGSYSFDPEGARALLAKHGIDPATLSFSIVGTNEERLSMGAVVQTNLADIGVEVTVTSVPIGSAYAAFGGFNSLTFLGYVRGVFLSESIGSSNRAYFSNDEVDELIRRAFATMEHDERVVIYHEISRTVNESVPHIPTHMSMVARAFNASLVVPETSPTGALHLNMMYWRE